jgi:hypothetical protein
VDNNSSHKYSNTVESSGGGGKSNGDIAKSNEENISRKYEKLNKILKPELFNYNAPNHM